MKLSDILTNEQVFKIREVAKDLGCENISLLKLGVEGKLGFMVEFSKTVTDLNVQCIALGYKLSTLVNAPVVVVDNSQDHQGLKDNQTVSLNDLKTARFKQVFSSPIEEIRIDPIEDPSWQHELRMGRIAYNRLIGNTATKRAASAVSVMGSNDFPKKQKRKEVDEIVADVELFVNGATKAQVEEFFEKIAPLFNNLPKNTIFK